MSASTEPASAYSDVNDDDDDLRGFHVDAAGVEFCSMFTEPVMATDSFSTSLFFRSSAFSPTL